MAETKISFQSAGRKLVGTVRVPDGVQGGERRPAWIVMHGFGSNSSSSNVIEPCAMFEKLGYVTLRFDMPGCGDSEGPRGNLICLEQVQAASDALAFLAKNPERRRRPHRHDRLELRRRHRGLCLRRRQARCRGDLVGRLGRRRAQVPRPASGRGGLEEVHRHAGGGQAPPREDRPVADGAALRHRADPAASARPSGAELDPGVHRRDRAEHVRLPRRRRDRQCRRPADPAAAFLGRTR